MAKVTPILTRLDRTEDHDIQVVLILADGTERRMKALIGGTEVLAAHDMAARVRMYGVDESFLEAP